MAEVLAKFAVRLLELTYTQGGVTQAGTTFLTHSLLRRDHVPSSLWKNATSGRGV